MHNVNRLIKIGWKAIDAIIVAALIAMISIVFANVVLRYAFNDSILGSVEMSRYLFVWIVMLGALTCVRYNEHLGLPLLCEVAPPFVVRILGILRNGVICLSGVMLCVGAYQQANANWENILPMSGIPVGVLYFSGVITGALMAALSLVRIFYPDYDNVADNTGGHA